MRVESVSSKLTPPLYSKLDRVFLNSLSFFFVFFLILGPKVSIFDTSILVPLSIVFLLLSHVGYVSRDHLIQASLLLLLIVYQMSVQFLNAEFDVQSVARLIRAFVQMLLVIIFYSVISRSSGFYSIPQIIVGVLFCHALLIILSALFIDLNVFMSILSGNDRAKLFRSSGLLAGFDLAGFLCICGVMIVIFITRHRMKLSYCLLYYLIFWGATFFTSRLTLAICTLLIFCFALFNILNSKSISIKIFSLILMSFLFYHVFDYFKIIFELTFGLDFFEVDPLAIEALRALYAADTVEVLSNMYFLPREELSVLFGTGSGEVITDVGYVRNTFRFGVVGVLASLLFYFALIFPRITRTSEVRAIFALLFFLVFLLSFKNDYYFVRAAFPLFLLLSLYNFRNFSVKRN